MEQLSNTKAYTNTMIKDMEEMVMGSTHLQSQIDRDNGKKAKLEEEKAKVEEKLRLLEISTQMKVEAKREYDRAVEEIASEIEQKCSNMVQRVKKRKLELPGEDGLINNKKRKSNSY